MSYAHFQMLLLENQELGPCINSKKTMKYELNWHSVEMHVGVKGNIQCIQNGVLTKLMVPLKPAEALLYITA